MSKSITVSSCAYVHTSDIDPTIDKQGSKWETLVNVCTTRAQTALHCPTGAYGQYHRNALYDLFGSLRSTHRSIRLLLALGDDKPESVDALALARLQLEALYSICRRVHSTSMRSSAMLGKSSTFAIFWSGKKQKGYFDSPNRTCPNCLGS